MQYSSHPRARRRAGFANLVCATNGMRLEFARMTCAAFLDKDCAAVTSDVKIQLKLCQKICFYYLEYLQSRKKFLKII